MSKVVKLQISAAPVIYDGQSKQKAYLSDEINVNVEMRKNKSETRICYVEIVQKYRTYNERVDFIRRILQMLC